MLTIDLNTCLSCVGCISVCPEAALYMDLENLKVDHDLCSLCRFCIRFCPVCAISLGKEGNPPRGKAA
jgi:ferredoxin